MNYFRIKIHEQYSNRIKSREVAREIHQFILENGYQKVVIDFQEVMLISRSFADHIQKVKRTLKEENQIDLTFENTGEDVQKFLDLVVSNKNPQRIEFNSKKHKPSSDIQLLEFMDF